MIQELRQMIRMFLQTTGNILSKMYAQFLLITVVRRDESVAKQTPKIFVANHPNTLDPFYLLGILRERVVILITEHVFHIPVLGKLVRQAGHIEVTEVGSAVYIKAKEALLQGKSLLIFAEGDISYSPYKLRTFRTGAVRLSLETGAPIIPIGIHLDASKIWKRKTIIKQKLLLFTWYRYGWYTVVFGKPVYFSGSVEKRALVRTYTSELRRHVLVCMKQARAAGVEDALLHKRSAKHGLHIALRGVYKFVCFVGFIFFKLNELGIKVLG
ncbi:MAG: lysophospholipid acyltransferase family protein [Microgenomates group bacterium]